MAHSYNYRCGCAGCCKIEEAQEREAEYVDNQTDILATLPAFIAEACFTVEEAKAVSAGLDRQDHHGIGRLLEKMLRKRAEEAIEYEHDLDDSKAGTVDRLINLYMEN